MHTALSEDRKTLAWYIVGGSLAGLSALGLVILGVIGSVVGGVYSYGIAGRWYTHRGLRAFLLINHLEWFFTLLCVLAGVGLAILFRMWLHSRRKTKKNIRH